MSDDNDIARSSLGELIRTTRIARGLRLRELARMLNVTPSHMSDIEFDRQIPADGLLRAIRFYLEMPADVTVEGD